MTNYKVAKFGGSLIEGASDFLSVKNVIDRNQFDIVVISATRGTTNLLEQFAMSIYQGQKEKAKELLEIFEQRHIALINELKVTEKALDLFNLLVKELSEFLNTKIETLIGSEFDQILSVGERTSSLILSSLLSEHQLFDVTTIIKTDSNFSNAQVDFGPTNQRTNEILGPLLRKNIKVVTQGFIGKDQFGRITTLGREGSDYTASILAGALNASNLIIFTDVPGVFEGDPKKYKNAKVITSLTYEQAELMAEQGAKVLFPKTLRPIKSNSIPLIVTNLDQESETEISNKEKEVKFAFVPSVNKLSLFIPDSKKEYFLDLFKDCEIETHQFGFFINLEENLVLDDLILRAQAGQD